MLRTPYSYCATISLTCITKLKPQLYIGTQQERKITRQRRYTFPLELQLMATGCLLHCGCVGVSLALWVFYKKRGDMDKRKM
jgi:hypothetical protein